jgi:periplasmic protein CpxP/Spy
MKITKIFAFILVVSALALTANEIFTQDLGKKTPEERAQKRAEKMTKHLSLNDDQYKQIYDAFLLQAQQIDALKSTDGDKKVKKEQMKSIRQNTDATITGLLSAEQNIKYQQFKEKRKEKHKQKKGMKKHKKDKKQE